MFLVSIQNKRGSGRDENYLVVFTTYIRNAPYEQRINNTTKTFLRDSPIR